MTTKAPIVRSPGGLLGTVLPRTSEGDDSRVALRLEDGRQWLVPAEFLLLQADGSYELVASDDEIRQFSEGNKEHDEIVVPIVAEVAQVGRRRVETGRVRVHKKVTTTDKTVNEPVAREEVHVERVPINRMIDAPVGTRQEGDTMIVPVLEEVLVVEKRLMLKEEVRITRRRVVENSPQSVTLRSEHVEIERLAAGPDDPVRKESTRGI